MGRGSSGAGGNLGKGDGGASPENIKNVRDLVSERERKRAEVDSVLTVARDIKEAYGVDVGQFVIADIGGKDQNTLAYYDGTNIGFNSKFFNSESMQKAYDDSVKTGFHPSRGNKTAMEAVAAHEYGHALMSKVAERLTMTGHASDATSIDSVSKYVLKQALSTTKHKGTVSLAKGVSGYAGYSNSECVAEAVSDVYCNGKKASAESRAIVNAINSILK